MGGGGGTGSGEDAEKLHKFQEGTRESRLCEMYSRVSTGSAGQELDSSKILCQKPN